MQRLELAGQFLHKDLSISGLADTKRFNRTRLALKLADLMDKIAKRERFNGKPLDANVPAAFTLEKDQVDFLVEKICALPMNGLQASLMGDFFIALENAKQGLEQPPCTVEDFDPASEDWKFVEEEESKDEAKKE